MLLHDVDGKSTCRFLTRAPVCAVMLRTYAKNQSESIEFWGKVRDGENLTRKDPEFHLREFLLSIQMYNSHSVAASRKATPHEVLYRCVVAWNSRRQGGDRSGRGGLKYFPNKPVPKVI